jgi:hypothetical protein
VNDNRIDVAIQQLGTCSDDQEGLSINGTENPMHTLLRRADCVNCAICWRA